MPLIDVGSKIPSFTLPDQSGKSITQAGLAGKPFVMYFYPKDDTFSCTAEACSFSDSVKMFAKVGARVIGISPDGIKSHGKFASKYKINITLLADEPVGNKAPPVCEAFGVWGEKSMYGKKYMGVIRTTYLVGADEKVTHRWDAVKVPGHVEEVLASLTGANVGGTKGSGKANTKKVEKTAAKKTSVGEARTKKARTKKASTKQATAKKALSSTAPFKKRATR